MVNNFEQERAEEFCNDCLLWDEEVLLQSDDDQNDLFGDMISPLPSPQVYSNKHSRIQSNLRIILDRILPVTQVIRVQTNNT